MLARENSFTVLPAVDVLDGRVVRLDQGRRERVTVEGGDPVAAMARFAAEGARMLHAVDLDGAFAGSPTPGLAARLVTAATGVPVQIGGGYRTLSAIEEALAAGAARVMVGTAALSPSFLLAAAARFGEGLVVAIDVRDGVVAVDGWTAETNITPVTLARICAELGVRRLLVTSTRRDGTLAGPDLVLLAETLEAGLPVLAAGGIASLDDLRSVRELGCAGAIAGSALWHGRFTLGEAATLER